MKLLVVGENVIDLISGRDGARRAVVGGGPANTAIALVRLGAPAVFATRIGNDAYARDITARLAEVPVYAVRVDAPSPVAGVDFDADGQAHYAFEMDGAADFGWRRRELPEPEPGDAVHLGSLAAYVPPGADVLEDWVEGFGADVFVSFDPNVRPAIAEDLGEVRERTERYAGRANLMRVSTQDVAELYGDLPGTVEEVARRWLAAGCGLVVVTDGGRGAAAYGAGFERVDAAAAPLPGPMADTVGAGDTFNAGMLAWLHRQGALDVEGFARVARDAGEVRGMLEYAYAASALSCTRVGADPPTAAEVAALVHDREAGAARPPD